MKMKKKKKRYYYNPVQSDIYSSHYFANADMSQSENSPEIAELFNPYAQM